MSSTEPRPACPAQGALASVADRQSLLVVREVLLGNRRFSLIRAATGLSRDVLTARLERLVEFGVLRRVPVSERRHEYVATPAGEDLLPVLLALGRWATKHLPVPAGQPAWEPDLLDIRAGSSAAG